MPKPKINGSLQPQRRRISTRFDPAQGKVTVEEFESAGDHLHGLAAQYERAGIAYDFNSNPVRSSLVVTRSGSQFQDEEALERWEAFSNQVQLDIKESAGWTGLSAATRAAIIKDADRHNNKGQTITGVRDWGTVGDLSTADHYFQLLIRGVTTFASVQWVLRYTANVSNTYQLNTEANSGMNTIYTMSQVTSSLPLSRLRSTLQSITTPAADSYLTFGWLKVAYSEVDAARHRKEVSSEFWLAQWPTVLY